MTRSHTTTSGCTVRVRAIPASEALGTEDVVEVVVTQRDGRSATYACSADDAVAVGTMIVSAAPRPTEEDPDRDHDPIPLPEEPEDEGGTP